MNEACVPYRRKALYLLLTVPMIALYVIVAALLWRANAVAFVVYFALFPIVALGQSYACVYWECPYVGRFGPCVGGICLPSSQIARLLKKGKRSERTYNVAVSVAFAALLGIIVLPLPFLYAEGAAYLAAYSVVVLVYTASFLASICPACAVRHVCPGGQASTRLRQLFATRVESNSGEEGGR